MALYRLVLVLALPLALLHALVRLATGRESAGDVAQRLGGGEALAPGGIWLHAASVGEVASAEGLVAELRARWPGP